MALEEGFVTYLTAQTGVTNLVSTRLYHKGEVPERTFNNKGEKVRTLATRIPYLVYEVQSNGTEHHAGGSAGIEDVILTVHCFDLGPKKTKALADAVYAELDGASGTWGSESISSCYLEDETTSYSEPISGHDGRHRKSQDYRVKWHRTIPTF